MNGSPRIIQNQYQLLSALGTEGGMGVVYRALDLILDREVAIKMVRPELLDNTYIEKRFQREAKALARLNHPNIANIYNFCRDNDEYCLVMEFVNGRTLADLLKNDGSLPQNEAIGLIVQTLHGLGHAHERGVLHRDLKPANLMLTASGTVKILDFGIAKLTDSSTTQLTLTNAGGLTGTIRYMAPELLDNGQPSVQSDLYALNLVLYELLTGRAAFRAPTVMRLMSQIVNEMPPPLRVHLPQAPEALENLMNRMMAKQPNNRLGTAAEFIDALTAICSGQPVAHTPQKMINATDGTVISAVVAPLSSVTALRPSMSRPLENKQPVAPPAESRTNRPRGLLMVAVLAFVLLVGGIWYWLNHPEKSSSERANEQIGSEQPIASKPAAKTVSVSGMPPSDVPPSRASQNQEVTVPPVVSSTENPQLRPVRPVTMANATTNQPRLSEPKVAVSQSPKPTETLVPLPQTVPIAAAAKEETPTVTRPAERSEEPVASKPESPKKTISVSRQMTLRLSPVHAYRADQLNRGDVVQFTVSAVTENGPVPLGQPVVARAVVSEVQASGELTTRSYIFLKRMVLETGNNETIKLNLASSDPEIRFDARQTNAVIGPLLMRPAKAFTID